MATPTTSSTDLPSGAVDIGDGHLMLSTTYPEHYIQPSQPRQPLPSRWTYCDQHPKEITPITNQIHPGAPALRFQTYGSSTDAPVDRSWFERLRPKEWLPACLVDLYLSEVCNAHFEDGDLKRFAEVCLLPSQAFYNAQETRGKWVGHTLRDQWESALEHTHVAFPMNAYGNHWLLGVITYASDLLQEVNPDGPIRTSLVILNSIKAHNPANLETRLRQMIRLLAIGKPLRQEGVQRLRLFFPPVPQQTNNTDCGLYPGHFLSVFLSDPLRFAEHCTGGEKIPGVPGEIWKASHIPSARETLQELAESLAVVRKASLTFHSGRTPHDLKPST